MRSFPLVSATGMLGSGFRADSLDQAISLGARMIGCDAGSTDPGPGPLATGTCMFSAAAVKRDTEIMMTRAIKAGIPLIIGSSGTSGSDAGLAWMVDIVHEIACEQDLHFKLAVIHSELSREVVHRHQRDGRARALPPSAPLSDADIDAATHIVGMMGVEPIQEALKSGAQIVVAGRSSDTSIFSALPLLEGYAPAVVWHMAKILECGAAAVAVRTAPDCMMAVLHEDSFDVFPLREGLPLHTAERRVAHALRKCRPVRAEGTVRHVADRQCPLRCNLRPSRARLGIRVRARSRIHNQVE